MQIVAQEIGWKIHSRLSITNSGGKLQKRIFWAKLERNIARIHLNTIEASSGCGKRKQSCEILVDGNNTKGC